MVKTDRGPGMGVGNTQQGALASVFSECSFFPFLKSCVFFIGYPHINSDPSSHTE